MNESRQASGDARQWFRHPRLPLIAIVLLGASLRLAGLGDASLWYDEGASLYLGTHAQRFADLFDPSYTSEPPLNTIMTAGWAAIVDGLFALSAVDARHDFLLRLLPFLFSAAALPVAYFLARRLFHDEQSARLAILLFALSPFLIYYAQELRVYSLVLLLGLLAMWAMILALEEGRPAAWFAMVLTLALLMSAHFVTMWYILALNVAFVLMLPTYKRHFWTWTAANAVLMVLIAPMLYRAFAMHADVQDIVYTWYPNPTWKTPFITFKTFFAGYAPTAWAYWPLFVVALGLQAVAWKSGRTHRNGLILLTCMVWVPLIGCAIHWGLSDFSFYEHRLFIVSAAAAILLAARGAALLGRTGLLLVAVLALFTLPCLGDLYSGRLHPMPMHQIAMWDKVDFRSAAGYLERNSQPGDRLLYAGHFSAYSMRHYYPGDQMSVGWSLDDEAEFIKLMGQEDILRAHHLMPVPKEAAIVGASRIWFLSTEGRTFEFQAPTDRLVAWFDEHLEPIERLQWKGVELRLYNVPSLP